MIKDRGVMILQGSVHNCYFSTFVWGGGLGVGFLVFIKSTTIWNIKNIKEHFEGMRFFPSAGKVKGVISKARNNFAWEERNISLLPDYGLETEQKNRCFFFIVAVIYV